MILLTLLLWFAALLALATTVFVYRWLRVSRAWGRLTLALAIPASLFVAVIAVAAMGWALGLAIALLFLSAMLLVSAYSWKVDSLVAKRTDEALARRPDLQERFERNRFLR
jgi:preprotein translocase subunit SecF